MSFVYLPERVEGLMIETNHIYQGDALEILRTWPDEFVQCVITSPPYWGLRDYGIELNPEYITLAEKRIEPLMMQGALL